METWKFVTIIDMTYYQDKLEHVRSLVSNTSSLCTALNGNITEYVNKLQKVTREGKATVKVMDNILEGMDNFESMRVERDQLIRDYSLEKLDVDNKRAKQFIH